jgi:hypothetical protein
MRNTVIVSRALRRIAPGEDLARLRICSAHIRRFAASWDNRYNPDDSPQKREPQNEAAQCRKRRKASFVQSAVGVCRR